MSEAARPITEARWSLASGTASYSSGPTKRMNDSRSRSWKLGLLVRQRIERSQHQELEHQHRIIGRAPTLAPIGTGERRVQHRAELFSEIDY
jgi:hypothetical protein